MYLLIAYDGTDFHGWQEQPGVRTVQGELTEAIQRVVRHKVDVAGSGRTDAGVHAAGQVASFTTDCELVPNKMRYSIGSRLAPDVAIVAMREVHAGFHATRSAASKLYRYRIFHSRARPVGRQTQRYVYHCWTDLDLDAMAAGARHFVGEMDFCAMASKGAPRATTTRRVLRCNVERHLDEVRIEVEGTGFLYKQVRTMVGTLMEVGRGRWAPIRVAEILASGDRTNAGPAMPAHGLCLQWVRYPPYILAPVENADDDCPDQAGTTVPSCAQARPPASGSVIGRPGGPRG